MPDTPSDQPAPGHDGRRGRPRRLRNRLHDESHLYPDVAGAVPEDQALPGELRLLPYSPGRAHPVTDDEALGVAIRRYRTDRAAGRGRPDAAEPTALPPHDASKVTIQARLSPRMLAIVRARAELEGVNTSNVIEEHLLRYALGVPEDPQQAGLRQRAFFRWFADGAYGAPPPDSSPGLVSPEQEQALHDAAKQRGISARQLLTEILDRALS